MHIDSPTWHLKKVCPCCNQGSSLILYTCNVCDKLIAICDEMFTNFPNPKNVSLETISVEGNDKDCPHCKSKDSLRLAKDFEILNYGLTPKEYE